MIMERMLRQFMGVPEDSGDSDEDEDQPLLLANSRTSSEGMFTAAYVLVLCVHVCIER